jgi:hypothetical protein
MRMWLASNIAKLPAAERLGVHPYGPLPFPHVRRIGWLQQQGRLYQRSHY